MVLNTNPVQMGWSLKRRLKRARDNAMRIFMVLWETQSPAPSPVFLGNYFSFAGTRFCSNSVWEQRMSSLGWAGKTTPQPAVNTWWWAGPVSPSFVLFLCPFQSRCLLEGQNVNTKLCNCLWPPVGCSCSSSSICRWYLHLLAWGTHVYLKDLVYSRESYATSWLRKTKCSSKIKFHLGHKFEGERGWEADGFHLPAFLTRYVS